MSYLFIAIIWINHHHLMRLAGAPTLRLMWINFLHLFLVSILPFATAMLVAIVAPRLGFGLVCAALIFHVRPDLSSGEPRGPSARAPPGVIAPLGEGPSRATGRRC